MTSKRIVFLMAATTGLVCFSAYSACLTSFLAVKRPTYPFEDKASLLQHQHFNIYTLYGAVFHLMFKEGDEIDRQIYREKIKFVDGIQSGLENLKTMPHISFYWSELSLQWELASTYCDYRPVRAFSFPSVLSFLTKKKWPYLPFFNYQ